MSVVLSMQDVGPWRKQLTVEVPAPAVEAETQRVVREYGQRVRIPGFRRGKVPSELVRRRFAKDIEREVIDRLLPRYWRQAQAEQATREIQVIVVLEDVGHAALSGLAVDSNDRFVGAADVMRIDREIGNLPDLAF